MRYLLLSVFLFVASGIHSVQGMDVFYPYGDMGVFASGLPPEFHLQLAKTGKAAKGKLLVKDYSGETVQEMPLELMTGTAQKISLPVPQKHGFYTVDAVFGDKVLSASFISIPLMQERDPFFAVSPADWFTPEIFSAYKTLAFGAIQLMAGFKPFSDDYNPEKLRQEILHSPYFTRIVKLLETHPDFTYYGHIGLDNYLISDAYRRKIPEIIIERRDAGYFCFPKEYYDAFAIYLEAFHKIAGERVKYWALVQEIDAAIHDSNRVSGGGPVELAHHLIAAKIGYNTLKKLDPTCQVSLTSTCGRDYHLTKPPFSLTRFILQHLEGKFDMIGLDAYNGNYSLRGGRERLDPPENGLRQHLLDAKILCREFGKDGQITIEERQTVMIEAEKKTPLNGKLTRMVADYTARETIIIKSVRNIPYYKYLDYGYKTDMVFWRYLHDENKNGRYTPFPAALAFATTARTLAFCRPARKAEMILPFSVYAYLFTKAEQSVVPIWMADENGEALEYELDLPAGCLMRDISGNDQELPLGKTVFTLSSTPLFLILPVKAETARTVVQNGRFTSEIQEVKGEIRLADGGKAQLFLVNQSGQTKDVECEGIKVSLAPYEKRVCELAALSPAKDIFLKSDGKSYPLPSFLAALPIPHTSKTAQPIILTAPENIFPRAASIPERSLILNDGKDIEVNLKLAWDEQNLYVDAKVRDRLHTNNNQGSYLWRGDSLQIGIVPDNQAWNPTLSGNAKAPFNISVALTDNGVFVYDYIKSKNRDWECQVTRSGLFTHYKLAIPWGEIKANDAAPGAAMAMAMAFFDLNKPGEKVEHWAGLGEGLAGGQNPSLFKTFILE